MVKGGLFVKAEPMPISLNRTNVTITNATTNFIKNNVTKISPSSKCRFHHGKYLHLRNESSPSFFNLSIIEQGILPIMCAIRTATLELNEILNFKCSFSLHSMSRVRLRSSSSVDQVQYM